MTSKPFRALALDGGGTRGLYTATVLNTLCHRFLQSGDIDLGKGFDLIAGTSTGGILACALAAGVAPQKIVEFYRTKGPKIFLDPMPKGKKLYAWAFRNRKKAAASSENLKKALIEVFREETVVSLYERRNIALLIPALNVGTRKAWVFKTPHIPHKTRDNKYKIVDLCLATSAAPFFLPLHAAANPDDQSAYTTFADGGLWANNPVVLALIEALQLTPKDQPIEIFSIGTCPPPSGEYISRDDVDRGIMQWKAGVLPLELSLDAQSSGYQFVAQFLAEEFTRLGRDIRVFRLPQSPPSSEQTQHLGLDQATDPAFEVLSTLGATDGNMIHSDAVAGRHGLSVLIDIFNGLPMVSQVPDPTPVT